MEPVNHNSLRQSIITLRACKQIQPGGEGGEGGRHSDGSTTSPELLLAPRGQVTVDEAEGGAVEHEGHAHCALVSCT